MRGLIRSAVSIIVVNTTRNVTCILMIAAKMSFDARMFCSIIIVIIIYHSTFLRFFNSQAIGGTLLNNLAQKRNSIMMLLGCKV